jgi:hypothetical protein
VDVKDKLNLLNLSGLDGDPTNAYLQIIGMSILSRDDI